MHVDQDCVTSRGERKGWALTCWISVRYLARLSAMVGGEDSWGVRNRSTRAEGERREYLSLRRGREVRVGLERMCRAESAGRWRLYSNSYSTCNSHSSQPKRRHRCRSPAGRAVPVWGA